MKINEDRFILYLRFKQYCTEVSRNILGNVITVDNVKVEYTGSNYCQIPTAEMYTFIHEVNRNKRMRSNMAT